MMRCVSCALDNDPSNEFCTRCHTTLRAEATTVSGISGPGVPSRQRVAFPDQRRPVWMWPLVIMGVAATVGVTVVAAAALSAGDGNDPVAVPRATADPSSVAFTTSAVPETTPSRVEAVGQARAVDAVLTESVASRRKLSAALQQVYDCDDVMGATADLRAVGRERESQISRVAGLDLSAIVGGERLRDLLDKALAESLSADQSYVRWAYAVQAGSCPNSGAQHRIAGDAASDRAGNAKTVFLAVWNPVASSYGLPTRTRDEI